MPTGLGRISITPARSSSRRRFESSPRESPGAPTAISLNVRQPTMTMFRMMMKDQRSGRSCEALATGQYWPYVRMPTGCHRGAVVASSDSELDAPGTPLRVRHLPGSKHELAANLRVTHIGRGLGCGGVPCVQEAGE